MTTRYFLPRVFVNDGFYPQTRSNSLDQLFNSTFPWKIFQEAKNELGQVTKFLPKLDVLSDEKNYIINVEIPGVDCNDVKLEVKKNVLSISGEKKSEKVEDTDQEQHITERSFGSFYRELLLPEDADIDNISAKHKDGVLNINIPKVAPKETSKSININRG